MIDKQQRADFQSLSEQKKIIKLEKAIHILQQVGEVQLELLERHEKSDTPKEIGYLYFFKTVKHTWENINFALKLGKGKSRHFNVYPTRVIYENVFRLEHYINQDRKGQNEISFWEIARLLKRFYDKDKDQVFKESYDGMVKDLGDPTIKYPDISDKSAYKDPFPKMETSVSQSKLPNNNGFYFHYQALCESHHSKLLSIFIAEDEIGQYRRNLMYIFLLTKWLLMITDSHIKNVTKNLIEKAFRDTDSLISVK